MRETFKVRFKSWIADNEKTLSHRAPLLSLRSINQEGIFPFLDAEVGGIKSDLITFRKPGPNQRVKWSENGRLSSKRKAQPLQNLPQVAQHGALTTLPTSAFPRIPNRETLSASGNKILGERNSFHLRQVDASTLKFQREAEPPLSYGNDASLDGIGRHFYCNKAISGSTVPDLWVNRRAHGFSTIPCCRVLSLDGRKPRATATCNSSRKGSFLNRHS